MRSTEAPTTARIHSWRGLLSIAVSAVVLAVCIFGLRTISAERVPGDDMIGLAVLPLVLFAVAGWGIGLGLAIAALYEPDRHRAFPLLGLLLNAGPLLFGVMTTVRSCS